MWLQLLDPLAGIFSPYSSTEQYRYSRACTTLIPLNVGEMPCLNLIGKSPDSRTVQTIEFQRGPQPTHTIERWRMQLLSYDITLIFIDRTT